MSQRQTRQPRSHGFTIVELLVTVTIIALLVGILAPTVEHAKAAGQQMNCAGTLHQLSIALESHTFDYKDLYPVSGGSLNWGDVEPTTGFPTWMEQLHPYTNTKDPKRLFAGCPPYPDVDDHHYFLSSRAAWSRWGAYASIERDAIQYTSQFVLAGDNNYMHNSGEADKDNAVTEIVSFTADADHWNPHHNNGLNLIFADGHSGLHTKGNSDELTYRYDSVSAW